MMKSDRRLRDPKRKDRRKLNDEPAKPFLQAPVILERRDRPESQTPVRPSVLKAPQQADVKVLQATPVPEPRAKTAVVPFFRRSTKFNTEAANKFLGEYPGHFVVGIVGQQGVGKSTILSHFMEDPSNAFPIHSGTPNRHKTSGIDMLVTPERTILLDTEPILSVSVLDEVLRTGTLDGLHPDLWLEMETLYHLIYLMSVCNVLVVVSQGSEVDLLLMQFLKQAEMLKFSLPDLPLVTGIPPDMDYYPQVVFVGNKCCDWEFTWRQFLDTQLVLEQLFADSRLNVKGTVSLGCVLPAYQTTSDLNLFLLPYEPAPENANRGNGGNDIWHAKSTAACGTETFATLIKGLREQVLSAPRRPGKRGQVSEREWLRNAVKMHELVRKSDYVVDFTRVLRKLRDG